VAAHRTSASKLAQGRFGNLIDRVLGADRSNRFSILLGALIAGATIRPFFEKSDAASFIFAIYLSVVLLGSLYAIGIEDTFGDSRQRVRHRAVGRFIAAAVLGLVGMVGRIYSEYDPNSFLFLLTALCWIGFLIIIGVAILSRTLRAKRVTFDTISAALCVYMMIGLAWAFIYSGIDIFDRNAFSFPHYEVMGSTTAQQIEHAVSAFMYYSFVTLATIGYGDITPVSAPARALSALEGIVGQFYIAILVASLVGIRIGQAMQEEAEQLRGISQDEKEKKEEP
jgi:Ion channel